MSDREIKAEEEHKDVHDEGGDDEVRAGSFCHVVPLVSTSGARHNVSKSLELVMQNKY